MPPMTASSCLSFATRRLVSSRRFITLLLVRAIIAASRFRSIGGQERRENQCRWHLGQMRLADRAVDREMRILQSRHRVMLDAERLQDRAHRTADDRLTGLEIAERPALAYHEHGRDLRRHRER